MAYKFSEREDQLIGASIILIWQANENLKELGNRLASQLKEEEKPEAHRLLVELTGWVNSLIGVERGIREFI